MITGEKKLLRAWTLFLPGGIRLHGAHEYTPPAINISTVDIKPVQWMRRWQWMTAWKR
ncbi:hypothetical protein [Escherichia coli]|uniref:hypothetical protein n=1 Tax=Escherichia coli TaxID=562 RepID=UPI00202CFFBF|nr:hypothetical protein [Escherichia coli]